MYASLDIEHYGILGARSRIALIRGRQIGRIQESIPRGIQLYECKAARIGYLQSHGQEFVDDVKPVT
jgi:hypothetical protein